MRIGGVAILWRDELTPFITKRPDLSKERICIIEVNFPKSCKLFIISVYLPHCACKIADFATVLNYVEEIVNLVSMQGEVVIMGDFNAQFGSEYGPRGVGKTSKNGKILGSTVERLSMQIVDLNTECTGPTYTYYTEGIGESYIDHCISTVGISNLVTQSLVNEDCTINTSDHLSLSVKFHLQVTHQVAQPCPQPRLSWDKLNASEIEHTYTVMLDTFLTPVSIELAQYTNVIPNEKIENALYTIANHMKRAAERTIPKVKFKKYLKSYWSPYMGAASKRKLSIWRKWKAAGKPRNATDPIWIEYYDSKKEFRRAQRLAEFEYDKKCVNELANAATVDHGYFWNLLRKSKGRPKHVIAVKDDDGVLLTDEHSINKRWAKYFCALHNSPPDISDHRYDEFQSYVDNFIQRIIKQYEHNGAVNGARLTVQDVTDECTHLTLKKAPGWDHIQPEHLKYGSQRLYNILTILFNAILINETVPMYFKRGLIVPIPKGTNKDRTDVDNYRGISLLPIMSKVFERVILKQLEGSVDAFIDELQGASHKSCSSLHTSFVVHEAVAYALEKGSVPVVALLDTRKAFDTVWHNGLFYKLYKMGCPRTTWMVLYDYYKDFVCATYTSGITSQWFKVTQGVHQGAPCSMKLYQVFCNELILSIKSLGKGLIVNDINVSCPTFADDITIMCLYKNSLQAALDVAHNHSIKWRFQFNPTKSNVIVLAKKNTDLVVRLGDNVLPQLKGCVHVGVPLSENQNWLDAFIQKRILKGERSVFAVMSMSTTDYPIPPNTLSKIYWSMSVPQIAYGLNMAMLSSTHFQMLETAHRGIAKRIQGLHKNTSNPVPLATMGWMSMGGHIDTRKLVFIMSMLQLPVSNLYYRLASSRILSTQINPGQRGPIGEAMRAAEKYGLYNIIVKCVCNGSEMSIAKWKQLVRERITITEHTRCKRLCILYNNMGFFSKALDKCSWVWWCHSAQYPDDTSNCIKMLRLVCELSNIHILCKYCSIFSVMSTEHLLFQCECAKSTRKVLWANVLTNAPGVLGNEMTNMNINRRALFIIGGFKCGYVREWGSFYSACAKLCGGVCNAVLHRRTMVTDA